MTLATWRSHIESLRDTTSGYDEIRGYTQALRVTQRATHLPGALRRLAWQLWDDLALELDERPRMAQSYLHAIRLARAAL